MHKILSFMLFAFLPVQAFCSDSEVSNMGSTIPFTNPLTIDVTVVELVKGLVYWAEPDSQDSAGIESIKKYISDTKTSNYMTSPFLFQFRIAGVSKEEDVGSDLTNDDFYKFANHTIETTMEGKSFHLICYGYYEKTIVPYCDLADSESRSPVVDLIQQGLLVHDERLGIQDESLKMAYDKALENAKKAQVGMWKPFHTMFRGLQ